MRRWLMLLLLLPICARADKLPVRLVDLVRGGESWKSKATYPTFGDDDRLGAMAGREVEFYCKERVRVFRQEVVDSLAEFPNPTAPYEQQITCTVSLATTDVVSFYLTEYTYTGGAHGATIRHAFVYGIRAGLPKRLELGDLFVDPADAHQRIEAMLLEKLSADERAEFVRDGTIKELGEAVTGRFVVTPTAVAWLVDQYEAAPYAAGMFTIKVPFGQIDGLDPRGPLAPLLR